MLFWFIGTAVAAVWYVFRDPAFDYRLLIVGAVLPAPVDAVVDAVSRGVDGPRVLHSVTFSVALLAVLMVVTSGRKPIRRTLLGLPVGTMLHLVFTGAWMQSRLFWWPFGGIDPAGLDHPVASRGWWNVPLELVGIALCGWVVRAGGLGDPDRRRWFARTGQLRLGASSDRRP